MQYGKLVPIGVITEENPRNVIMVVLLLVTTLVSVFCIRKLDINEIQLAELTSSLQAETKLVRQILNNQEYLMPIRQELEEPQGKTPEAIPMIYLVETVTEVPVYIENEKIVPQDFRIFEDETELIEWLEKAHLPVTLVANSDGIIDLYNPGTTPQYDCDDYSEDLQTIALEQGFLMSQQLVLNGRIFGIKVSEYTGPHMGNLAIAGDDIYYVESIPPHNVVKICGRD